AVVTFNPPAVGMARIVRPGAGSRKYRKCTTTRGAVGRSAEGRASVASACNTEGVLGSRGHWAYLVVIDCREFPMLEMTASYGQFCPVAMAAEVFCTRWTPLILRELLCGSRRFNDLRRGVPRMSPSLLSKRLKELAQAGIIETRKAA